MKNKYVKNVALILMSALIISSLTACGNNEEVASTSSESAVSESVENTEAAEFIDYAAELKLDMSSDTLKQEVTVKAFVDGDTTHFNVPESVMEGGVLKARYLAINTPESTGKIEEYGKKASNFTKEKLSSATSIIIESDDSSWDLDSTGGRNLVWVWYRTSDTEDYRNLNLEILQNGLAIASSSANNRYGDICMKALANAKACKLNVHSGEADPDFFYGEALEIDLKELRTNVENYLGSKVAFEGVVTRNSDNSVFVEEYDSDTDRYYGITVFYGYGLSGEGLAILKVGNRVRIVGSCQFYENGGTYQISGLTYRQMKPDDPGNIMKLGEGYEPSYVEVDADTFINGKVTLNVNEEDKEFAYGELSMDTSISMKNLNVVDAYTTSNPDSSSYGAITLNCESDGVAVTLRTSVLYDENGNLITQDKYVGKNIDVKGIVGYYNGTYQIKVLSDKDITINN